MSDICTLRDDFRRLEEEHKNLGLALAAEQEAHAAVAARLSAEVRIRPPMSSASAHHHLQATETQRLNDELAAALARESKLRDDLTQETSRCLLKDAEILKSIEQMQERGRALAQAQGQYADPICTRPY